MAQGVSNHLLWVQPGGGYGAHVRLANVDRVSAAGAFATRRQRPPMDQRLERRVE